MRWKRRIKPKIDQQISSTRRFTKVNTVLSCAPSIQFHLGTDVRYHYAPKYTVFHVFFKIAVHWKELASSNFLQQRRDWHNLRWWAAIWPHSSAKVSGLLGKIKKKTAFLLTFLGSTFFLISRQVSHGTESNLVVFARGHLQCQGYGRIEAQALI